MDPVLTNWIARKSNAFPRAKLARYLWYAVLGLVVGDLQSARRAGRYRLAYRRFTGPLLVNDKLPVDNLKHCRKTFDAVPGMDAYVGVIGDSHSFLFTL
jgi:hypothetical protein